MSPQGLTDGTTGGPAPGLAFHSVSGGYMVFGGFGLLAHSEAQAGRAGC